MQNKNILMAHRIAEAVSEAGGKTFFVGGCVRDEILGHDCKDFDIEIHGITLKALNEILDKLGERLEMGVSFGITKLRRYDLDISMPRSKSGEVDPFIGTKNAALRRDFTMNALMKNVITGEILDYFGGIDDIKNKIIKHVSDYTFIQDPLRVFRAARFSACFDFEIDEQTFMLASDVDVSLIASERIFGELEKVLLKSERPSKFFTALKNMNQISTWFEEFENFNGEILDKTAKLKNQSSEPLFFMMSALCLEINDAEKFLARITKQTNLIKYVLNIKENIKPLCLLKVDISPNLVETSEQNEQKFSPPEKGKRAITWRGSMNNLMKIFDASICPDDLILLFNKIYGTDKNLRENLEIYKSRIAQPYLTGKDLISKGFKPGLLFGEALKFAHDGLKGNQKMNN